MFYCHGKSWIRCLWSARKHDDNSELGHLDTHIMVKECFSCVFFTFLHFQLSAMINADTDILANS